MPLSSPTSRRALKHTRAIQLEAFARDDGLWDVDAHITDTKTKKRDVKLASGMRSAGAPLYDPWLLLSVDMQQSRKPFQLDRRHALRSNGPAAARYYPRWAVKSLAVSESS